MGITTHAPSLQRGLDIEEKSERVACYAQALCREQGELLAAMGGRGPSGLNPDSIQLPSVAWGSPS